MSHAFDNICPIGLGTARFPFPQPETYERDFENAVNLVLYALECGINYIDVGKGYSNSHAFAVLKEAFQRTGYQYNVTIKINSFDMSVSEDEYYREALAILQEMGLESASHFLLWTLMDVEHFHRVIEEGNLYTTALRLQKEGKIKHIGTSVHMKADEILEVIDSGLFEFVLISCHLLNLPDMQKVLDCALEKDVDILVMNPLYGGLIPQNTKLFEYARFRKDETVVQAAIRALLAHPAVKCVLAGASDRQQLDEYLSAAESFLDDELERKRRLEFLSRNQRSGEAFCSYCRYCAGCPVDIPVPELMNSRNILSLQGNKDRGLTTRQTYFRLLNEKYEIAFESGENPCIQCGRCESKCTQHLEIIPAIDEIYQMVKASNYDLTSRKNRLDELLNRFHYRRVGFWPASAGTMKIIGIYEALFGNFPFEVYLFDSNQKYHGKNRFGHIVHAKEEILDMNVDCILITSYRYGTIIRQQLKDTEGQGVDIKQMYRENDVDWWW